MKTITLAVVDYTNGTYHKYLRHIPEANDVPGLRYSKPGRVDHIFSKRNETDPPIIEYDVPEPMADAISIEGVYDALELPVF
jgi:hypothetical protein